MKIHRHVLQSGNKVAPLLIGLGLALSGCAEPETRHDHHDTEEHNPTETSTHRVASESKTNHSDKKAGSVRSAQSHIHGGATLSIVSENKIILIEFESPLYNLLGFEHPPQTKAEKTLTKEVEATLAQPQNLISFNKSAKCTFVLADQKIELFNHKTRHDEHDDEHGHDKHDEEEDSDSHNDVILSYSLTCEAIEKLKTVNVKFFETFSNLTDLDLVYLGPSQQMSVELTPSRTTAELKR